MALSNFDVVDIVLRPLPGESGKLTLLIIDSENWTDMQERCRCFHLKLNSYVQLILSAHFIKDYPKIRPHDVVIRVLTIVPPDTEMLKVGLVPCGGDTISIVFQDYHSFKAALKN